MLTFFNLRRGKLQSLEGLGCRAVLVLSVSLLFFLPAFGQTPQPQPLTDPPAGFEKAEHMIQMRDGVHLFTIVYSPKEIREPLPFIFFRTPYGVSGWGHRQSPEL